MIIGTCESPLGTLGLVEEQGAITRLTWGPSEAQGDSPLVQEAARQLRAYFAGALEHFDLDLRVSGSPFLQATCDAMSKIPKGHTRTYGELATDLDSSAQAVGNACGANPIPIIIPCHRVVGSNGVGGFSGQGGTPTKLWLLKHEGAFSLLF